MILFCKRTDSAIPGETKLLKMLEIYSYLYSQTFEEDILKVKEIVCVILII